MKVIIAIELFFDELFQNWDKIRKSFEKMLHPIENTWYKFIAKSDFPNYSSKTSIIYSRQEKSIWQKENTVSTSF